MADISTPQRMHRAAQERFRHRSQLPIDPVTNQPVYRGMPVPWAARWTGEAGALGPGIHPIGGALWSAYGQPTDLEQVMNQRDANGILWWRDVPDKQGQGVPQFAEFHAYRHRECMLGRRCQVCSRRFGDDPVTFLVPRKDLPKGGAVRNHIPLPSFTPPTCPTCVPIVLSKCPGQRANPHIYVEAEEFEPWKVHVDWINEGSRALVQREPMKLNDPRHRIGVAKQLGVMITKWREVGE